MIAMNKNLLLFLVLLIIPISYAAMNMNGSGEPFVDTDTLQTVTDRGATTTNGITVNSLTTDDIYSSKTPLVTINDDLEVTGDVTVSQTGQNANIYVERDGQYSIFGQATGGGYLSMRDSSGITQNMFRAYGVNQLHGVNITTDDDIIIPNNAEIKNAFLGASATVPLSPDPSLYNPAFMTIQIPEDFDPDGGINRGRETWIYLSKEGSAGYLTFGQGTSVSGVTAPYMRGSNADDSRGAFSIVGNKKDNGDGSAYGASGRYASAIQFSGNQGSTSQPLSDDVPIVSFGNRGNLASFVNFPNGRTQIGDGFGYNGAGMFFTPYDIQLKIDVAQHDYVGIDMTLD